MPPDFRDMLSRFNEDRVEYLVVGAYAMAAHACPRATGDIDFWVRPSKENAQRVFASLARFGAPLSGITVEDFTKTGTIFQMGLPPLRIDVLTSIEGVAFDDAWPNRLVSEIGGLTVNVIGRDDLLANKRVVARPKDLGDVVMLERQSRRG